jgi:hypothetical protein
VLKAIDEQLLGRVSAARAIARARAWDAGARPETITLEIDATLLTAHSEKELAAGNYEHGYGFHPLSCYLDETGEVLAAILRPGNAGSNTAEDHFTVLGLALGQLPAADLHRQILVRTDIGGQTHAFTADCRDTGVLFSVGYELSETVRSAILEVPEAAWVQAINADGVDRDGAWAAEGVSEEACKCGRRDQPCPRELTAGSIKKRMLLSARSEATPEPQSGERCFLGCRAVRAWMSRWRSAMTCWTRCLLAPGRRRRSRARMGCWAG